MARGKKKGGRGIVVTIVIMLAAFVGMAAAAYWFLWRGMISSYEEQIKNNEDFINQCRRNVYMATTDIPSGTYILEENVSKIEIIDNYITQQYLTEEDFGKIALVDISANAILMSDYVGQAEISNTTRLVEYSCFHFDPTVRAGDYLDVRIRYQNGEDLVVLAHKRVEDASYNTSTAFLKVDEYEAQRMASAVVDAVSYEAILYAVKYTQPTIQSDSTITYIVNGSVAKNLWDNSVITENEYTKNLEARSELENRQALYLLDTHNGNVSNVVAPSVNNQSNVNNNGSEYSSGYDGTIITGNDIVVGVPESTTEDTNEIIGDAASDEPTSVPEVTPTPAESPSNS